MLNLPLRLKKVLLILSLCCYSIQAIGQSISNFKVKNDGLLKVTNYLPSEYKGHAQNWSFAQDARGVIYVGNMTGALQFDGSQWRKLPIETYQVVKGASGRIYTGFGYFKTNQVGQLEYQSFLNLVPKDFQKIASPSTRTIIATPKMVAFYKIGGLFIYQQGKIKALPLSPDFIEPLHHMDGELLMVKKNIGLMKLTGNSNTQRKWELIPGGDFFADKRVTSIIPFTQGQWLLSTYQNGLYILDKTGIKPWDVSANEFLKNNQINCSLVLNKNQIAFGTLRNGVLILNKQGKPIQWINQRNGLTTNYVRSLFLDKDKTLWIGLNNGIARVEIATPFSFWNKNIGLKGALNHIAGLHKGKFYVGTSQGVFYRDYAHYVNPLRTQSQFKPIEATKGSIFYLLDTPDGVLCANRKGIHLIKDTTATQLVSTRSTAFTIITLPKQNHKYAIATTSKDLILLENKDKQWRYKSIIEGYKGYIRYLHQTMDGYVWITAKAGVYRFKLSDSLDKIIEQKLYTTEHGLPHNDNNNVFGLSNGEFVCGTSKGIYLYDKTKDKFEPHPLFHQKLKITEHIQWIKEGKQNTTWIWTKTGIVYIKKNKQGKYVIERNLFNKYQELFSNYMAPHVIPIDEKNILFETRHGVVHYNSTIDKNYQQPFNVLIRKVSTTKGIDSLLFAGNFSAGDADKIISKQPDNHMHILPFQSNNIYFSFSAVFFEDAPKTQYSYLLENFDAEWSEWTHENKKEYTNLPAGKYTFRVKARNVYGAVSKETTYKFEITPPWYQTTWAYMLFVVVGVVLFWGTIQLYTRRLKQQKEKLEILVHERTQKIEAQADTLKEINEEIIQQRDKIDQAYQNVQLLSEIGKDITATFSMADISNIVYQRIQNVMDVEEFGIGYYLPKQDAISFSNYYHKGKTLPPLTVPMSTKNRLAVHCVAHKKEIIIGDLVNEYQGYVEKLEGYGDDELLNSMICLPLLAGGEVIGIASVQSSRKNAYSKHQINIFRNLAIYIAIALKNANSYTQIDHQNMKITDSIRYAQNIQATILPSDKMMHRCFEDHAIVYWPKDIVSGDFYWLLQVNHPQTNDLYTFVSVIDCTGHGVPGAFMSLIGYQLLNDIVQRHVLEPHLMLEELDRLIVKALRQRETENKDGMDVCMCRLQKLEDGTTELLYSGAKRDLFYMEEGEWKMIKGDRVFIGGFSEGKDTKFNNNVRTLQAGTQIYMSSDGIADMPNDRRRSFGMRRLNNTLQDNAHLPMEQQKQRLIEAIRAHQGNQEQRDDVTLLAVKI